MTLPTYRVLVDWDSDGGLNVGDFETGLEDWTPAATGTSAPSIETSTTRAYHGSRSLQVTWSAGGSIQLVQPPAMPTFIIGRDYTMSAWVWQPTGGIKAICAIAGISFGSTSTTLDAWTQISYTFTATATTHLPQIWAATTPAGGEQIWVDYVQIIGEGEELSAMSPGVVDSIDFGYGRAQARALQPVEPGEASFTVDNVSRDLSPENSTSPLVGLLGPGRDTLIEATYNSRVYTGFAGQLDGFDINSSAGQWSAKFTAIDGLARLKDRPVSTQLYPSVRTGEAINIILDAVGWTSGRSIDSGASTMRWWWAESDDAYQEVQDILATEGPDALCSIGSNGEFIYRDRHHRLRDASIGVVPPGGLSYVGVGAAAHAVNASVTPTLPTGLQRGDVLLVQAAIRNSGAGTPNTPTGWEQVVDASNMRVYGRYYDTGVTAPTVTFAGGVANADTSAQVFALRGVSLTPVAVTPVGSTLNGSAQNINVAALTWTSAVRDAAILVFGWKQDDWTSVATLAGGIEVAEPDTTTGDDQGLVADYALITGTSFASVAAQTFTVTGGVSAISRGACLVLAPPSVNATFVDGVAVFPEVELDPPVVINHGWRDVINRVEFSIQERNPGPEPEKIWEDVSAFTLSPNQTKQIEITTDSPFWSVQTPTQGTPAVIPDTDPDFVVSGGTLTITFSRTSGQTTVMSISSTSTVVVQQMRVRAFKVTAASNAVKIVAEDAASITTMRGVRPHKPNSKWLNQEDARAIADLILGKRANRLPVVTFTVPDGTQDQITNMLGLDLSDRIHVTDSESGFDADCYIERIEHRIDDEGLNHKVQLSAEKVPEAITGNLFRFDVAGAGFNDGVFAGSGRDDPSRIFLFDVPGRGFDQGMFAT